jgi:hypothetical protein
VILLDLQADRFSAPQILVMVLQRIENNSLTNKLEISILGLL